MKKSKIILRLAKLGDADLEARSLGIVAAMTGNPHFTDPTPSLADINNGIQLFSDSLANAKTGDRVKATLKNQHRDSLKLLLTNLASYCSFIARGDRYILASSGFTLNAESSASITLAEPSNFNVVVGSKTGAALVYVNVIPGARAYLFRWGIAPIGNEAWFHTMHSQPWFTITGLVPGTIYSFQIGAAGSKGQLVFTKTISQMVV